LAKKNANFKEETASINHLSISGRSRFLERHVLYHSQTFIPFHESHRLHSRRTRASTRWSLTTTFLAMASGVGNAVCNGVVAAVSVAMAEMPTQVLYEREGLGQFSFYVFTEPRVRCRSMPLARGSCDVAEANQGHIFCRASKKNSRSAILEPLVRPGSYFPSGAFYCFPHAVHVILRFLSTAGLCPLSYRVTSVRHSRSPCFPIVLVLINKRTATPVSFHFLLF